MTYFALFASFFENKQRSQTRSVQAQLPWVIPAWSAGIQIDMDVSGSVRASLDAGHPNRHDEDLHFHSLWVR
jgi:hypothetical protein